MKTKRIKFLIACALAALSQMASAGSYWLGKAIDRSALVAGDYVYVSCAKSTSENVYVSARLLKSSDGTGRSVSCPMSASQRSPSPFGDPPVVTAT